MRAFLYKNQLLILMISVFFLVLPSKSYSQEKIKIGLCMDDFNVDRWYKDRDFFVERINQLGGEAIVEVANSDDLNQLSQAKKLLAMGVKVLVVVPTNGFAAGSIVQEANKYKAKVIAYDRLIMNCNLDYYISYDNEKVGELQAEYLTKIKPEGNYVILNGPISDNNALLYKKGQMKVLKPFIDNGKINLVYDLHVNEWTDMESLMALDDYFSDKEAKKVDVVIAGNDNLAMGALMALEKYSLQGNVLVAGQDAELSACRQIVAGNQTMTVYKPIKPLAYTAAEAAMKLAKNKGIENISIKVNNGMVDVPSILLRPVAIGKNDLISTVIADGFYKEEEVYKK